MIIRLFLVAIISILAACAQQESDDSIKTGGGGNGGRPKPTNSLHRHVMLTLAGWSDLHTIVKAVISTESQSGCVSKTASEISWACGIKDGAKVGRGGKASITRSNGSIEIETPRLGLYNYILQGKHVLRGEQDFKLTLVPSGSGYRFRHLAALEIPVSSSANGAHYRFVWDFAGTLSIQGSEWVVTNSEGSLNVIVYSHGRSRTTQFKMDSALPLGWKDCGTLAGKFSFSGDKQDLTTVVADQENGVRKESGGKGYAWPLCAAGDQTYGLLLTAPFWAQPEP